MLKYIADITDKDGFVIRKNNILVRDKDGFLYDLYRITDKTITVLTDSGIRIDFNASDVTLIDRDSIDGDS